MYCVCRNQTCVQMIIKVVIFCSCFAADDFAPSQKLQRQRIFCSPQSIIVNRSYIVGKKIGIPKSTKYHPPPKKNIHTQNTHIPKHTHAHTTRTHTNKHNHGAWRAFEVVGGGGSEHNVLCTLSRFALSICLSSMIVDELEVRFVVSF